MSFVIDDVLVRNDPANGSAMGTMGRRLPVLFDSPHSGRVYPADFQVICPHPLLRQAEDTHVEELFATAPDHGATLLCALFPRTCIDVNRAVDDIDPALLDGAWPTPLHPTARSMMGMGLIRSMLRPGVPLYDGKLPAAVVADRIDRYYRPYHAQMRATLDRLAERFGAVWHVNCHSMPSTLGPDGRDPLAADFVIGDRDGTTSEAGFVALVAETLRGFGHRVAINDPYKGVELLARYGDPARGRHSIQLEINRRLYMNEETLERHDGFARLKGEIDTLIRRIADHAERRVLRRAAE
ncbi:N-formylglutamate amidohydrolase [Azospirillum sp. TSO35-2]|uniref:N-formylglutamate amidohydrolase n=1 Tax=Azospirillum sp. TSO35-2 TaxID=716796 RepID=UPI000D60569A|nr:N-formylglutamate amidohydrolase [Azospirillum sp. TSO35-2]PWC32609.1 N-formylglutamate amidohydrolase [Azospirillum sp. TSO35-2]